MAKIFVLTGADVGLEFELAGGVLFGRAEDCNIRLKDPSISRHHARLEKTDKGCEIVDLGSRNGLTVDGARVERSHVADGGEFTLGNVRIRYVENASTAVEEIELAPSAAARAEPDDKTLSAGAGRGAAAYAGAARRRAIAKNDGILQFEKVDDAGASPLSDEFAQYGIVTKIAMFVGALIVAAGLFYGALKIASRATPERADNNSTVPEENGK
ncbi:MAG: FHA domain-containing protein [Planctomycetes bacterium]|nr:FHA domain-containing protein [Planctomycetota bacterium]